MGTVENHELAARCKELSYYKVRLICGITRKRYLAIRQSGEFKDRRGRPANLQVEQSILNYVRQFPQHSYRRMAHHLGVPPSTVQYIFIKHQLRTISEREQFAQVMRENYRLRKHRKKEVV